MPPSLLDSQLSTVQPLEHDEPGVTLDVSGPITQIVDAAVAWIDQLYGHAALDRTPHPGTGHPTTIRDVAVVAGVSRGTVSRYFNQPHLVSKSAFERIGKAIDELGFVRNEQAQKLGLKRRQQHAGEVELSSQ